MPMGACRHPAIKFAVDEISQSTKGVSQRYHRDIQIDHLPEIQPEAVDIEPGSGYDTDQPLRDRTCPKCR